MAKATRMTTMLPGRDGNPIIPEVRKTDQDSGQHIYNCAESPIDWLLARHIIEGYQHAAGERFRRDWEISGISPARAIELREKVDGGGMSLGISNGKLDAMNRVNRALGALNHISRVFVVEVCGEGKRLETVRVERVFSKHYVGPRFREALDDLARHYGLA